MSDDEDEGKEDVAAALDRAHVEKTLEGVEAVYKRENFDSLKQVRSGREGQKILPIGQIWRGRVEKEEAGMHGKWGHRALSDNHVPAGY